jgi:HD-GYP domain-containing protein (c-di-GMP phosphodiesterase class II)
VRHHHERWDGGGYPSGLIGEAIPYEARVVAAVDAYSAMTADRPYRRARSSEDAFAELERSAGSHLDPAVVTALLSVLRAAQPAAAQVV